MRASFHSTPLILPHMMVFLPAHHTHGLTDSLDSLASFCISFSHITTKSSFHLKADISSQSSAPGPMLRERGSSRRRHYFIASSEIVENVEMLSHCVSFSDLLWYLQVWSFGAGERSLWCGSSPRVHLLSGTIRPCSQGQRLSELRCRQCRQGALCGWI